MTREEKIEMLFDFFMEHVVCGQPEESMEDDCPFGAPIYCEELCGGFSELRAFVVATILPLGALRQDCPCHYWGKEEALKRLERTLIIEGWIEE